MRTSNGRLSLYKFVFIFTLVFGPWGMTWSQLGPVKQLFKIKDIQVQGNKKVEKEAVLEKITSKPGMALDNYTLKRDLEKIYGLKFFESVEAHRKGSTLIFKVTEKPIVTKISFEGNDELDVDELKEQIKAKEFAILDVNSLKNDIVTLQKQYEEKGFYLASVNYEVRKLSKENVEVIFRISEFDKVRVKKIIFLGNKAFSDFELKGIMETREESLFSAMSGAGNFKEFNFQTDIERIKYFYKTKGYLQINVGTPEITVSEDKRWVFISLKVNEGPLFTVRDISFRGEVLFPTSELESELKLKSGENYSEEILRKDIQRLTEMYQDQGYAFANVLRTLRPVPGENKVDVEFAFEKGKIAYFGKITVKGNTKTRDKVIRRELKIREGAKFSGTDLRLSKENVNRLGFFEPGSIVFNTISPPGKDDVLDVEIEIKERNTGQISLGAGYSTAQGMFLQGSIAQNNFLGKGQNLNFSLLWSNVNKTFNIGFTEPYLFDTKWTSGFDIYSQNNEQSRSLSFKRVGTNLRVGYPIFEYTRLFLTYKIEDTESNNAEDPTINLDVENGLASIVRTSMVNDRRDNIFEPSKGYYLSLATEYAGVGGRKKWWKTELDGRYFKKVIGDLVLRSRLYVGNMEKIDSEPIPRSEKFTLGGARNLRGYDFEAVGYTFRGTTRSGDRVRRFNTGSLFAAYSTVEFEHPLSREAGLKWVVFFDAGDAREPDDFSLKSNYGFGFRWFSPIGVLRFEFGYPLNPSSEDESSQFHFDIGQLF